jgi:molybdopterin molybdotransferase
MIPYAQALRLLAEALGPQPALPEETVALAQACGRVSARRILGAEALPPFDNSAMDGYAVKAAETADAPLRLAVKGSVFAGDAPLTEISQGAYEITTGGPLPPGCDAVVPIEQVTLMNSGRAIEVQEPAHPGDYVRPRGRDFQAGAPILEAGTPLEPRHILALAALGVDEVQVRRRPRLALIATGKELAKPGRKPGPGQIRNSTSAYIQAALPGAGAELLMSLSVGDDPAAFKAAMSRALGAKPDIVLTTGAVSMGRHDFVAAAVGELGAKTLYHKTAIRPGKPGLVALFPDGGPLFFGLPGNPLSTVVGLRFFVLPVLRRLLGLPEETPRRCALAADAAKPAGLRCFYKAFEEKGKVRALLEQASFQIRPLLDANCWLVLPEEGDLAQEGLSVDIYPL